MQGCRLPETQPVVNVCLSKEDRMSINATSTSGISRDNLLQELIAEGLDRSEIEEALNEIGLSKRELLREIDARLGAHDADIWASAEPERQEVQRIATEAVARTAAIDAESQIDLRGLLPDNWKKYAIFGICAMIAFSLSEVGVVAYSMVRIGLITLGSLLLIVLGGLIVGDWRRLERDRRRRHQELANELDAARQSYRAALLDRGVLPFVRQVMNDPNIQKEYYGVRFNVRSAPGLQGDDPDFRVETAGSRRLKEKLDAMPSGGNFGIAGPRGSGKTTALNAICDGHLVIRQGPETPSGSAFRILVSAPVEFSSREFLLHLYAETWWRRRRPRYGK